MRYLYIKRERALACFAIPYHCVIGQDREEHLRRAEGEDRAARIRSRENAVGNGGTIRIPLGEEESTLFVIAWQEHGALTTETLPLPAGDGDLYFTVTTRYDGGRHLSLVLAPAAPFSGAAAAPAAPAAEEAPRRKLAVFFPGIGYTADRPLLHYSRRLAAGLGYELRPVSYGGFPAGVLGDRDKMTECYRIALAQATRALADIEWERYDDILFVGKSVGTSIAAWLASKNPARDRIRLVLFTPLEETFTFPTDRAIVFTGTADPWVGGADNPVPGLCEKRGLPCVVIPGGNHSLETEDVDADLRHMRTIMAETARFLRR